MQRGRGKEALTGVERLAKAVGNFGSDLGQKAESLIVFTKFVLGQYPWAFDQQRADSLAELIRQTTKAQQAEDSELLRTRVEQLDRATDDLPAPVPLLLSLRQILASHINPYDPAAASALGRELAQVEEALRRDDRPLAAQRLRELMPRLEAAFEAVPPHLAGGSARTGTCTSAAISAPNVVLTCGSWRRAGEAVR